MSKLEARCGNTTAGKKKALGFKAATETHKNHFFAESNPGISLLHGAELSNATFSVLKFHL